MSRMSWASRRRSKKSPRSPMSEGDCSSSMRRRAPAVSKSTYLGVDIMAAPGHKGLYGPMGIGALVLSAPISVKPFRVGGTGFKSESPEHPSEYPWRLEAGTINLPGIAGLAAGVRFVNSVGINAIAEHEATLA